MVSQMTVSFPNEGRPWVGGDIGKDSSKEPQAGSEVSLPRLSDIVFPRGTPLWTVQALEMFKSKVLGVEWSRVVHCWVTFRDFDSNEADFRPECVRQRARSSSLWEFGPCEEIPRTVLGVVGGPSARASR